MTQLSDPNFLENCVKQFFEDEIYTNNIRKKIESGESFSVELDIEALQTLVVKAVEYVNHTIGDEIKTITEKAKETQEEESKETPTSTIIH